MTSLRALPEVIVPFRPVLFPLLPWWPREVISPNARELSVADRTSRVVSLKVSPHKLVAYIGDVVTFVAMGTDLQGQPAHGAKIEWQSSDADKLMIDEAGRASCVKPRLVRVTAQAGFVQQTAVVLIRPTRRPLQTDDQWRADQDSLVGDSGPMTGDGDRKLQL
jgi:hypothetical protein